VAADIPSIDTIARGGTNSGSSLNNKRIMVSSGGSIVEAAALTNGQLLMGSTGAAPVAATITAGSGISITNGAGSITITATGGVYGTQYSYAASETESSTASTTFVQTLRLTTASIPAGDYRIQLYYEWRSSSGSGSMSVQAQIDDTTTIHEMDSAPEDSFSYQSQTVQSFSVNTLTATTHTVDLDYKCESGSTCYIKRTRIEIVRVS
jgi:hypothetical protein